MRVSIAFVSLLVAACGTQQGAAAPASIAQAVTAAQPVATAEPPPAIRGREGQILLRTLEGKPVKLADYGSSVTVIAMWATFCEPCLAELPQVEALYRHYRSDKSVSVLAVSVDDTDLARVRKAVAQLGLTLPVLIDAQRDLARRFTPGRPAGQNFAVALPAFITIDPTFRFSRHLGYGPREAPTFVPQRSALIELARMGQLPEDKPEEAIVKPEEAVSRIGGAGGGQLKLVNMTLAQFREVWPGLRKQLESNYKIDEPTLEKIKRSAEERAKQGDPVTIDLPATLH
jgi:thiol-disulfide isomerase/thioredoxin